MTSRTGSVGWDLKSQLSFASEDDGWLSLARRVTVSGAHVLGGGDGKVVIERWYLSPYVEKPLNSKVIKSFVPELRRRKCFSCFGIPMFYLYMLWTFYVRFTYPYHGYVTSSYLSYWSYLSSGKSKMWKQSFCNLAPVIFKGATRNWTAASGTGGGFNHWSRLSFLCYQPFSLSLYIYIYSHK